MNQAQSGASVRIVVSEEDFNTDQEYRAARARLGGSAGAIASFVGLVRDHAPDGTVQSLYLEHYPGMTEKSIAAIVARALERWRVLDVVVIHRVGNLPPEAQIVLVQIGAGHRSEAFAACEFIMDYLKTDAVFWKREQGASNAHWVEATSTDRSRVSGWAEATPQGAGDVV